MANYYADSKKAATDLYRWITDNNRGKWSEFLRRMNLNYGFGKVKIERMFEEGYPEFYIKDDILERVGE